MFNLSKIYNFLYSYRQGFFSSLTNVLGFLSVKIYLVSSILINISSWVLTFLFKGQLSQNLIVLHFNVDFGIDLIGGASDIFLIPFMGLLAILVNFFILSFLTKDEHFKFLIHLLLAGALLVNLFLLIALGPIYYINFR